MQIGQKVKTLGITSPVVTGTIVAMMTFDAYVKATNMSGQVLLSIMDAWDRTFKDYRNKPVVAVDLDLPTATTHDKTAQPQKGMSYCIDEISDF